MGVQRYYGKPRDRWSWDRSDEPVLIAFDVQAGLLPRRRPRTQQRREHDRRRPTPPDSARHRPSPAYTPPSAAFPSGIFSRLPTASAAARSTSAVTSASTTSRSSTFQPSSFRYSSY